MLEEGVWVLCLRRLFDIISQGEDSESCGGFSWSDLLENPDDLPDCEPETRTEVSAVPDVTAVPVSPSSVVTVFFEDVSLDSDWEFVEPQPCSFSKKRAFFWTVSQEEMRYGSSPVKAPPPSRRRMMPSTPQQSSYSEAEANRDGGPGLECS